MMRTSRRHYPTCVLKILLSTLPGHSSITTATNRKRTETKNLPGQTIHHRHQTIPLHVRPPNLPPPNTHPTTIQQPLDIMSQRGGGGVMMYPNHASPAADASSYINPCFRPTCS
ncbi:hypothetical protein B0T19DRAFT_199420 [Cercophora scortea]|uniref:Uncharacterized protein n=1 Tax=Cercophora scortea TaxID=314031 RepID=A0AAE0IDU8_9PEZI|nr:hypothetical protein B0T19DRAFT_199420 [Cercophora scortea]